MSRPGAVFLLFWLIPSVAAAFEGLPFAGPGWRWTATERLVPSVPVPASASGLESDFASAGDTALVVWAVRGRILATRIDAEGRLIDPYPEPIGLRPGRHFYDRAPKVACHDGRCLVIWQADFHRLAAQYVDHDGKAEGPVFELPGSPFGGALQTESNGSSFLVAAGGLTLTLLSPGGTQSISAAPTNALPTAIATDGENYLVLTESTPLGSGGAALLVSSTGELLRSSPISEPFFVAGWDGSEYVALSASGRLQRITADGTLAAAPIPAAGSPLHFGSVARAAQTWLAWSAWNGQAWESWVGRLDGGGLVDRVRTGTGGALVASAGGNPLVVYATEGGLRHAIIAGAGKLEPPEGRITAWSASDQGQPAVTATTAGFFALANEHNGVSGYGKGIAVSPRGGRFGDVTITPAGGPPTVASNGDRVAVAWYELRDDGMHVRVLLLSATGEPVTGEPVDLAMHSWQEGAGEGLTSDASPGVVWNGFAFVIAWMGGREGIRVGRVTPEGIPLDPGGIPVGTPTRGAQSRPALAVTADVTLLAWQDGSWPVMCRITCPEPPPSARIYAIRLDQNLHLFDPHPFSPYPERLQAFPAVAAKDGIFLVAATGIEGIEAARVTTDGLLLDAAPLLNVVPEVRPIEGEGPAAAAAPGGFLIAGSTGDDPMHESAVSVSTDEVRLAFVPLAGPPDDAIPVPGTSAALPHPELVTRADGSVLLLFRRWSLEEGVARRIEMKMLLPPPAPRTRPLRR